MGITVNKGENCKHMKFRYKLRIWKKIFSKRNTIDICIKSVYYKPLTVASGDFPDSFRGFLKYAHDARTRHLKCLYNYAILQTLWTYQNIEWRRKNTLKNKMAVSGCCMNVGCSTLLLFLAVLSLFRSFKGF